MAVSPALHAKEFYNLKGWYRARGRRQLSNGSCDDFPDSPELKSEIRLGGKLQMKKAPGECPGLSFGSRPLSVRPTEAVVDPGHHLVDVQVEAQDVERPETASAEAAHGGGNRQMEVVVFDADAEVLGQQVFPADARGPAAGRAR